MDIKWDGWVERGGGGREMGEGERGEDEEGKGGGAGSQGESLHHMYIV